MADLTGFYTKVLKGIGVPVTPQALANFSAWQKAEGGWTNNAAAYNPLNTTRGKQYGSMNSVGVRVFPNEQVGVRQTIDTLQNGHYGNIIANFGRPTAQFAQSVYSSPWGTKHGIAGGGQVAQIPNAPVGVPPAVQTLPNPAGSTFDPRAFALQQLQQRAQGKTISPFEQLNALVTARALASSRSPAAVVGQQAPTKTTTSKASNGFLQAPAAATWKGTHVTDGLGWGTNTAEDIMAKPGTAVGAPESGVIERHGSAQGGQSLYFRSDSGREYWLGHIESNVPVGTRVKAGQTIATISADHPRPHLHIDWRKAN